MKITCEHCGSTINIEKDKVCPSCSAPYHNNAEFKKLKSMHMRDKELNLEMKETINERIKSFNKKTPILFIIPIVVFVLIFFITIFNIIRITKSEENFFSGTEKLIDPVDYNKKDKDNTDIVIPTPEVKEDKLVNIDNPKWYSNKNWKIKVDKYIIEKESTEEDTIISFHVIVKHTKNEIKILPEVHCLVDNVSAPEYYYSSFDIDKLSGAVYDNVAIQGYVSYKIPADTKKIVISFDGIKVKINL